MPTYISLINFTQKGAEIDQGRAEAARCGKGAFPIGRCRVESVLPRHRPVRRRGNFRSTE